MRVLPEEAMELTPRLCVCGVCVSCAVCVYKHSSQRLQTGITHGSPASHNLPALPPHPGSSGV